jgi:hypothetical protein
MSRAHSRFEVAAMTADAGLCWSALTISVPWSDVSGVYRGGGWIEDMNQKAAAQRMQLYVSDVC